MVKDKLIRLVALQGLAGLLICPMKKEVELKKEDIIGEFYISELRLMDDLKKHFELYGLGLSKPPVGLVEWATFYYDHKVKDVEEK